MLLLRWNVPGLIETAGGADKIAFECERAGYGSITPKAVRKWKERDSIPPRGLAALALMLRDRGYPLTNFITQQAHS